MIDKIKVWFHEDSLSIIPGLDDAILGVEETGRIIYSVSKANEIAIKNGMSEEEAHEYVEELKMEWTFQAIPPIWCIDDL